MPDTEKKETEEHSDIRICDTCETPLIMTFMVPYKEYYCTGCGSSYEFLGAGSQVEWTPELHKRKEENEAKFKAAYKNMVPPGAMMDKCEKCSKDSQPHRYHMTDEEKAADVKAKADLKEMILPEHRDG